MAVSNYSYHITRQQDLFKVDVQIRDIKDIFITCPPLSGLSNFLSQVQKHLRVSDHFSDYKTLLFDCKTQRDVNDLILSIAQFAYSELGIEKPILMTKKKRKLKLSTVIEEIAKQNDRQKTILILDNFEDVPLPNAVELLESIRVIAETRSKNPYLRNVIFILAGHSLDLRKLDPKHSSPFNTATQIYLEDFSLSDAIAVIKEALVDCKYTELVPDYIDFLTYGHPHLIDRICYHLRNEEDRIESSKGITFEFIDSIAERITSEQREDVFRSIDESLSSLSSDLSDALRKLLNGTFYKNVKLPYSFKELKLLGLIGNSRNNKWHIRNYLIDSYIRQHPNWISTIRKNNFVPRRLFANIEGYKILFDLENNMREFLVSQLFDAFGASWENVIKTNSNLSQIVNKWENMKRKNLGISWLAHDDLPSISFGLFPEIKEVIDEYWGGMFEKYFKPKVIFEGSFESLEVLRNKIAHNRSLSDKDIDVLSSIAKQFNDCMYENSLS